MLRKRVAITRTLIGLACVLSHLSTVSISWAQAATTPTGAPPSPVASGLVPINDVQIYYATYGSPDNEPLVLIHGRLGNADEFIHQLPAFVEQYYVVVFDARGRGRSATGNQPLNFALLAADTLALMDYLGIDSANLVGWSDGGTTGLEIAVHHPERITKLVAFGAQFSPAGSTNDSWTNWA